MDILRQTLFQSQCDSVGPSRPLDDVEPLRRPMAGLKRAAEGDPARRHPDRAARRQNSDKVRTDRRCFVGGSDARIIMGADGAALIRLWKEKRGEAEPEDLSDNLVVQLGVATEALNRSWYERNTVGGVRRALLRDPVRLSRP